MPSSRDRAERRLTEAFGNLRDSLKGLAFASVRYLYWRSGAAPHDPNLHTAINTAYWQGVKSKLKGWTSRGVKEEVPPS